MSSSMGNIIFSILRLPLRSYLLSRTLTSASHLFKALTASFEEVKAVKNQKSVLLVDVREPSELQETGVIPASVNIPLDQVELALKLPPNVFKEKYGRDKPDVGSEIIFSCRMGKRSANAQETAFKLGFQNVKSYEGGWLDWENRIKQC